MADDENFIAVMLPPIESRLTSTEKQVADVRVAVASVEQKVIAQDNHIKDFRAENARQYEDLKAGILNTTRQLEPLKEHKWKMTGAASVMAAVISVAISLITKLWK
jgi:predicted  nucleic acid-binding Zn-ribbon protein